MTSLLAKAAVLGGLLALTAACQDGQGFATRSTEAGGADDARSMRRVDRDIEAPEAFQLTDQGLWDGRPSLGGVWVAHADVKDPERVIIRNQDNDKFVIGALFRRERNNPGPSIQVSSDAAEALGMLAGAPATLNVTALRREDVAEAPEPATDGLIEAPEQIEALSLDGSATDTEVAAPARPPEAKPAQAESKVARPYVQIGIFSVKANANDTATALRGAGMTASVNEQTTQGKTFYRVLAGPAASAAEKTSLLAKVKDMGFNDAYFVSN
ncbi:SPOR domain-containing protein [Oceaniglobus indicus]|uniref:SPOR domain-containing protein n=1 Tax=Oceaniglobus indicus TaxID=2047749 RepID=UPI000C1881B8|nr:SPOR domain-containing protein [Oceaniglobus indicus]